MKKRQSKQPEETPFYGWARVSKRGQVFIPKRALSELKINPSDLLMVVKRKDGKGVTLVKIEAMEEVLQMIQQENIP